jgi:transketolase
MLNYSKLANAIRILSIDAVEKASSGHPGMPMGMADIATVLWKDHLNHNPLNPLWVNRDRFVLSNGHGSMLLYSLLHLTGYNVSINDIKNFRQLHSKTPGHPEYGYTDGVETTTGPLGQGLANAVGMALAEKLLAHEFNKETLDIINHYTYVFVGDGCLMEGISHEVCSFAGTNKLNKLIIIYDDNGISIDGKIEDWYTENVSQRFISYGFNVIENVNGHDFLAINQAILQAKQNDIKPTIIICKTIIGKGSPNKSGKEDCHGAPLGTEEVSLIRKSLNWDNIEPFVIEKDIYKNFDCKIKGNLLELAWQEKFNLYQKKYPDLAKQLIDRMNHNQTAIDIKNLISIAVKECENKKENIATRKSSQNAIEFYSKYYNNLLGGSADLTGSNLTSWKNAIHLKHNNNFIGNYISYGVREFGMCAIMNGIYLHGGYRPFGGTFLMFSEYARNALRMASLMKIAPIFVFTHDSIGLGEDGPTHQPVEQLATLRMIPNMNVWRPCDTVETMVAWGIALQQKTTPSSLIFSRQNAKFIERTLDSIKNIEKGGYILAKNNNNPDIIIIATGTEVELAQNCYNVLITNKLNYKCQLVSMPSTSCFDKETKEYREEVIPQNAKYKIVIEAGISDNWYKYVGINGLIIGIDTFGESGKISDLLEYFALTQEKILTRIIEYITK